jgi:hypothetical protein
MTRLSSGRCLWLVPTLAMLLVGPAAPQETPSPSPTRPAGRMVPVAEAKLLMVGINQPNFQALEALLRQKPTDPEAWKFARGQALLIAESGNLLLLRPPHNEGRDAWLDRAVALRVAATSVARAASAKDYEGARGAVVELANVCNQCHQTFRVTHRIQPFADVGSEAPPEGK